MSTRWKYYTIRQNGHIICITGAQRIKPVSKRCSSFLHQDWLLCVLRRKPSYTPFIHHLRLLLIEEYTIHHPSIEMSFAVIAARINKADSYEKTYSLSRATFTRT